MVLSLLIGGGCAIATSPTWPANQATQPLLAPLLSIERQLYDSWFSIRGPQLQFDSPAVVVGFDSDTEGKIGKVWPPPRKLVAEAVSNLRKAGAKAIAIDILFEGPSDNESDQALTQALKQTPQVTLAARFDRDPNPWARKKSLIAPYYDDVTGIDLEGDHPLGLADIVVDEDQIVRRFAPQATLFGEPLPSLALSAWNLGNSSHPFIPQDGQAAIDPVDHTIVHTANVNFEGGSLSIPVIADLADVALGKFDVKDVRGKTVFIGATGTQIIKESGDSMITAATSLRPELVGGAFRRSIPGVILHAQFYNAIARQRWISPVPTPIRVLIGILFGTLVAWIALRFPDFKGFLATLTLCALGLVTSLALFQTFAVFWPVGSLIPIAFLGSLSLSWFDRAQLRRRWAGYVSPDVMREILTRNEEPLRRECTATILFLDIRGFTAYAANKPPTEVVEHLNRFFEQVLPSIESERGTVDKFMGDGLLVVFGAPLELPNSAESAARAAQNILDCDLDFKVGIGLATGQIVSGHVGTRRRHDFTVIGEKVNLASRIQSLTTGGEILMDHETMSLLGQDFTTSSLGMVEVRGFDHEMPLYRLDLPNR